MIQNRTGWSGRASLGRHDPRSAVRVYSILPAAYTRWTQETRNLLCQVVTAIRLAGLIELLIRGYPAV